MTACIQLRAQQEFTTAGIQTGSLAIAMDKETTEDLQTAYYQERASGAWAHPLFGHNARQYEAAIAQALKRRGIESFYRRDLFGLQVVTVH